MDPSETKNNQEDSSVNVFQSSVVDWVLKNQENADNKINEVSWTIRKLIKESLSELLKQKRFIIKDIGSKISKIKKDNAWLRLEVKRLEDEAKISPDWSGKDEAGNHVEKSWLIWEIEKLKKTIKTNNDTIRKLENKGRTMLKPINREIVKMNDPALIDSIVTIVRKDIDKKSVLKNTSLPLWPKLANIDVPEDESDQVPDNIITRVSDEDWEDLESSPSISLAEWRIAEDQDRKVILDNTIDQTSNNDLWTPVNSTWVRSSISWFYTWNEKPKEPEKPKESKFWLWNALYKKYKESFEKNLQKYKTTIKPILENIKTKWEVYGWDEEIFFDKEKLIYELFTKFIRDASWIEERIFLFEQILWDSKHKSYKGAVKLIKKIESIINQFIMLNQSRLTIPWFPYNRDSELSVSVQDWFDIHDVLLENNCKVANGIVDDIQKIILSNIRVFDSYINRSTNNQLETDRLVFIDLLNKLNLNIDDFTDYTWFINKLFKFINEKDLSGIWAIISFAKINKWESWMDKMSKLLRVGWSDGSQGSDTGEKSVAIDTSSDINWPASWDWDKSDEDEKGWLAGGRIEDAINNWNIKSEEKKRRKKSELIEKKKKMFKEVIAPELSSIIAKWNKNNWDEYDFSGWEKWIFNLVCNYLWNLLWQKKIKIFTNDIDSILNTLTADNTSCDDTIKLVNEIEKIIKKNKPGWIKKWWNRVGGVWKRKDAVRSDLVESFAPSPVLSAPDEERSSPEVVVDEDSDELLDPRASDRLNEVWNQLYPDEESDWPQS